jgi:hypothetical protein
MTMQKRAEERSLALHKEIAKILRENPDLWDVPQKNIAKWQRQRSNASPVYTEWKEILDTKSRNEILSILEDRSEEAIRLRSSSPFTGILSRDERDRIFELYR